jgi:lysyl-tRNA synthetase class 2
MKRLLAAGGEAIYQVTRSFRNGEQGRMHNPEFTIVEWYRRGDDYGSAMDLTSELCDCLLGRGPAERLSYQAAFQRHVGADPHTATSKELADMARRHKLSPPASLSESDRDGWLNFLLAEQVEPHLDEERPTILYDYPASQAALAQVRPGDAPVAERFELYVTGIELANGYHELRDAAELRARIARANQERLADGKPALPAENRLLSALEAGLPSCCGVALGFDRLVMLAAGATSLAEVMPFPIDRA